VSVSGNEPIVDHEVLRGDRSIAVARCALGLTLYLDDPLTWAKGGVARALEAFLRRAPTERLEWYTTSMMDQWIRTSPSNVQALVESLPAGWTAGRPRHLFAFRLVDDTDAPECWFSYREVDPALEARPGFLSVGFPQSTPPRTLLDFVVEVASAESYVCGTAGYVASFNEWEKPTAFTVFHRWAKRFAGLDLEDPDRFAWVTPTGLVTTSWLTLLGRPLLEHFQIDVPTMLHRRFRSNVEAVDLRSGILVRAGSDPTLGDVNQLRIPHAYAEVARALEPYLCPALPPMYGPFSDAEETLAWQRRLIDVEER
jgi:hypothetical protein